MLGEKIRKLRQSRKINQIELANKLGVSKQSVSNWENNNILPSIEVLIKIADYFSCSTDFLLRRNTKECNLNTDGLTLGQVAHLQLIADDFKKLNQEK